MSLARVETGARNLAEKSGNSLLKLLPNIGRNRILAGAALAIGIVGMTQAARAESPYITYDKQPYGFSVPNYCDDRIPQPTLDVSGYQETTVRRLDGNGNLEIRIATEATGFDSTGSPVTVSGDSSFGARENKNGNFKVEGKGSFGIAVSDGLPNESESPLKFTIQGNTILGVSRTRMSDNGDLVCGVVPIR